MENCGFSAAYDFSQKSSQITKIFGNYSISSLWQTKRTAIFIACCRQLMLIISYEQLCSEKPENNRKDDNTGTDNNSRESEWNLNIDEFLVHIFGFCLSIRRCVF